MRFSAAGAVAAAAVVVVGTESMNFCLGCSRLAAAAAAGRGKAGAKGWVLSRGFQSTPQSSRAYSAGFVRPCMGFPTGTTQVAASRVKRRRGMGWELGRTRSYRRYWKWPHLHALILDGAQEEGGDHADRAEVEAAQARAESRAAVRAGAPVVPGKTMNIPGMGAVNLADMLFEDDDDDDEDYDDDDDEDEYYEVGEEEEAALREDEEIANDPRNNFDRETGDIIFKNTQRAFPDIDEHRLEQQLREAMAALGVGNWDLGVWLTTDQTVRELNSQYRSKAKSTDILSFPVEAFIPPGVKPDLFSPYEMDLGEMVVSLPYVARQIERDRLSFELDGPCTERGVSGAMANVFDMERRLTLLMIHGLCHLVGHDHEEDGEYEVMVGEEERLVKLLEEKGLLDMAAAS